MYGSAVISVNGENPGTPDSSETSKYFEFANMK